MSESSSAAARGTLPAGGAPPNRRGTVQQRTDGLTGVLFERRLAHSVEDVWAAITAPEQRAVWVPGIQFDPKPAARFDIWFGDDCDGPAHVSGTLDAFEPLRLLQLGSIRLELEQLGQGCLLRFSDVLWFDGKRTKAEFAKAVLAGWHQFLDRLELWLNEGRAVPHLPEPDYSEIDVPGC